MFNSNIKIDKNTTINLKAIASKIKLKMMVIFLSTFMLELNIILNSE